MRSPEEWARVRELWERGGTNAESGNVIGVTGEAVRKRALAEGWQRADGALEAAAEERHRMADAANQAAKTRWAERRIEEADAAGVYAAMARQRVAAALDDGDHNMTRAASIAYGIFIDKAQLLTGGATSRYETGRADARERASNILDELGAKRAERQENIA